MCRSRAGAARRAPGCAPMSQRLDQPPFSSPRPALPARSVRPPPLSLRLFFLLLTALFPLCAQLSSPFPSKDGPEGERLPLALRPADGKGFPTSPPPPAWKVPAWGFEVVRRATLRVCPALLQRMGPKNLLAEPGLGICKYILSGAAELNLISL